MLFAQVPPVPAVVSLSPTWVMNKLLVEDSVMNPDTGATNVHHTDRPEVVIPE